MFRLLNIQICIHTVKPECKAVIDWFVELNFNVSHTLHTARVISETLLSAAAASSARTVCWLLCAEKQMQWKVCVN